MEYTLPSITPPEKGFLVQAGNYVVKLNVVADVKPNSSNN